MSFVRVLAQHRKAAPAATDLAGLLAAASSRSSSMKMILCVTLNPCLDRTLETAPWRPGDLVRGGTLGEVAGGKGNNVARALAGLDRKGVPITFLGGTVGERCRQLLVNHDHLQPIVIPTQAPTRIILTVRTRGTPLQTAFFDPDPAILDSEAANMLAHLVRRIAGGGVQALALCGSSPAPSTHGLYQQMIELARRYGVPSFLDTYGPALEAVRGPFPNVIKLNRREAGLALGRPAATDDELWSLLEGWAAHGVQIAAVTDGPGPVLALIRGARHLAFPPPIEPVNPIGSGDCLLAGLIDGWLAGLEPQTLLAHAVAAAVANALVWDAGAIDRAAVDRLRPQVRLEKLP